MRLWTELLKQAIIGIKGQPFPSTENSPLAEMEPAMAEFSPEKKLLTLAGTTAIYRRAGQTAPFVSDAAPPKALPETKQICSELTASLLERILRQYDYRSEILEETFGHLADKNLIVPSAMVGKLLKLGEKKQYSRLFEILGSRGRWVAEQHPVWQKMLARELKAEDDVEAHWHNGNADERRRFLTNRRETAPAEARELLQNDWPKMGANEKKNLLPALRVCLSMDDAPFLNEALQDRSKEVKQAAFGLAVRLPASDVSFRLAEYVDDFVKIKNKPADRPVKFTTEQVKSAQKWGIKLGASLSWNVKLADTFRTDYLEMGVNPKTGFGRLGEKASYLVQIFKFVALSNWTGAVNASPLQILTAAAENEHASLLLFGLLEAAGFADNQNWYEAFIRLNAAGLLPDELERDIRLLFAFLPAERAETLILEAFAVDSMPIHDSHPALEWLNVYKKPWSARLTEIIYQSIVERSQVSLDKNNQQHYQWHVRDALPKWAGCFNLSVMPTLAARMPEDRTKWGLWEEPIDKADALLTLRQNFHQSL